MATPVPVVSESCRTLYPVLLDYMLLDRFDDGSARKTTTLTFFLEDGALKVCVKDREESLVAFPTSDSFEGLLGTVEALLAEERMEWRPCRTGSQNGRRKKN